MFIVIYVFRSQAKCAVKLIMDIVFPVYFKIYPLSYELVIYKDGVFYE